MKLITGYKALIRHIDDESAIDLIKASGFDGIEFNYEWPEDGGKECPGIADNYIEYSKNLRAMLDGNGLVCAQGHAPFHMRYGHKFDVSEKRFDDVVRSMESAAILGAPNTVVHAIVTPSDEEFVEYNLAYYKALEPYCEQFGIQIAVENLWTKDEKRKCFKKNRFGTPDALASFIDMLDSPWFTACIDIGHAALTAPEPEDFIRKMPKGYVSALHVHDVDYVSDSHVMPYLGDINWQNVMRALKEIDYRGELTYEIAYGKYDPKLFPGMMQLHAAVGRHLISIFEGE